MVFRTAAGIATLLIGLNSEAVAQYYPSPAQAYPREAVPPVVTTEELPPINAPIVDGGSLPPVGAGPLISLRPPTPYDPGSYPNLPHGAGPYDVRGLIPPGPPGSAKQDRQKPIRP